MFDHIKFAESILADPSILPTADGLTASQAVVVAVRDADGRNADAARVLDLLDGHAEGDYTVGRTAREKFGISDDTGSVGHLTGIDPNPVGKTREEGGAGNFYTSACTVLGRTVESSSATGGNRRTKAAPAPAVREVDPRQLLIDQYREARAPLATLEAAVAAAEKRLEEGRATIDGNLARLRETMTLLGVDVDALDAPAEFAEEYAPAEVAEVAEEDAPAEVAPAEKVPATRGGRRR
jgi:hypothetical protein